MKCPHCGAGLLRRERPNKRCSKCKKQFIFEPLTPPGIHDIRFKQIIDQMHQGRWFYTPNQLLHQAARKSMLKAIENLYYVEMSGFAFLLMSIVFVSMILSTCLGIIFNNAFVGIVLLVGIPVLSAVVISKARPELRLRTFGKKVPLEVNTFVDKFIAPWEAMYGHPTGLLTNQDIEQWQLKDTPPSPDQARAVVACPQRDVLICLRANQGPERLNIQLIPTCDPFTPRQQAVVERLRREPDLPLVVLHDASAAGFLLSSTIIQSLGLHLATG